MGFVGEREARGFVGERERRGVFEGEVGESIASGAERVVLLDARSRADIPAYFDALEVEAEEVGVGRGLGFAAIFARGRNSPQRGGHAKY